MKKIVMLMLLMLPTGANAFLNQITKYNSDTDRQFAFCGKTYDLTGIISCSSSPVANLLQQITTDYGTFGIQYDPVTGQYNANLGNGYDPYFCDCPATMFLEPNSLAVSCTDHVTGHINGQPWITGVMIKIEGGCTQQPPPPPPSCTTTWQDAGVLVTNFKSFFVQGTISMAGIPGQTNHTNQFADCAAARPFTEAWITANYGQIAQEVTSAAAGVCPAGTTVQVADTNTILNQCRPANGSDPNGNIRFRVWDYPIPVMCCQ